MPTRSPDIGANGWVLVRLSQVPIPVRMAAAEKLIRKDGLRELDATEIRLAAFAPVQDPEMLVDADEYKAVLG